MQDSTSAPAAADAFSAEAVLGALGLGPAEPQSQADAEHDFLEIKRQQRQREEDFNKLQRARETRTPRGAVRVPSHKARADDRALAALQPECPRGR